MMNELTSLPTNLYRFFRQDLYRNLHFHVRGSKSPAREASAFEVQVLSDLERLGGHLTQLEDLGPSTAARFSQALPLIFQRLLRISKGTGHKSYASQLTQEQLLESDIHLLGLDESLLRIAEKYIGMPVRYRGVEARRDFVDDQLCETRLWHRDPEDYRILKVIVYLNDVMEGGGPFQFFPVTCTRKLDWAPKNKKGRLDEQWCADHFMSHHSPITCHGKAGSIVFADTCRVYHRGQLPTTTDRYALFFAYTSLRPAFPEYSRPLYDSAAVRSKYCGKLSTFQEAALASLK